MVPGSGTGTVMTSQRGEYEKMGQTDERKDRVDVFLLRAVQGHTFMLSITESSDDIIWFKTWFAAPAMQG